MRKVSQVISMLNDQLQMCTINIKPLVRYFIHCLHYCYVRTSLPTQQLRVYVTALVRGVCAGKAGNRCTSCGRVNSQPTYVIILKLLQFNFAHWWIFHTPTLRSWIYVNSSFFVLFTLSVKRVWYRYEYCASLDLYMYTWMVCLFICLICACVHHVFGWDAYLIIFIHSKKIPIWVYNVSVNFLIGCSSWYW